ncbi:MAG: hypothetical protein H6Q79_753 [Deltaproteobacteria bacterium]|nr:hypothetical protein [Deltaproteobacteria bacterium]
MKTGFPVMALMTALLAAAMPGNVLAEDNRAMSADPGSAMNRTWMGQDAIDTGKLPDAAGGSGGSAGNGIVQANTDIPIVEAGGVRYRLGIDAGP